MYYKTNTYFTAGTLNTPHIEGDISQGTLSIRGKSLPEDTKEFYEPLINWLEYFYQAPSKQIEITFDIEYYNTSTSNLITQILKNFMHVAKTRKVKVKWVYEEDDVEMKEIGEDYQQMIGEFIELESKENSTESDPFKPEY